MMQNPFQHVVPTRILYGPGILEEASAELEAHRGKRALLVTEKILGKLGLTDRVKDVLERSGIELVSVFDGVIPNSEVGLVTAAAAAAREAGANMVVALGGGSAMDTAKAVNIVLTMGGHILDYQGAQLLDRPLHPLIAIPTTAGTGSEVTNVAVIHDAANGIKVLLVDHHLAPDLAILDPTLTLSLPARFTAATGMDALTHAIEGYTSTMSYPIADGMALQAIGMIAEHLPRAVEDGQDVEARGGMLVAATIAGMAFVHAGVGIIHALSHTLGGLFGVGHGEANSILLPHGMAFNLEPCLERFARVARQLDPGLAGDEHELAVQGIQRIVEMRRRLHAKCGLAMTLQEVEVPKERLGEVAQMAMIDGAMIYNRRSPEEAELLALLETAHEKTGPDL